MSKITGLDSFFEVLDLVKDPKKYEAKVKEIKEATDKYQVVIESVVELAKVNEYTASIRTREEKTKEILANAEKEATKKIEDAVAKSKLILDEVSVEYTKAKQATKDKKELVSKLQEKELELEKAQASLNAERNNLAQLRKDAETIKIDLEERLAKLKSAMQ